RFDIFQLGSDTYNYRKAQSLAYGNDAGLLGQYVPSNAGTNAYTTAATPLTGTNPWIWSGDGKLFDMQGGIGIETNNGIIIRDYKAFLGGQVANTPYFRERSSSNPSAQKPSQYCLVPPPTVTSFAQGDSIELLLEAICLPKQRTDYYGADPNFIQALLQYGNTWELMQREVVGNAINAISPTNAINTKYPLAVTTTNNTGLVIVTGGKNYIPIVFKGLTSITDPKLWKARKNCWELVNQANHGKDFWQTEYDTQTGLFELIYNVKQDITNDSTAIIKYYLGDTPPVASLVLDSKVNQAALALNPTVAAYEGDSVVFAPQITEHGITSIGNTGQWAWTGPNGFTNNTRAIKFPSALSSNTGNYTVTYTDAFGCSVSAVFQLTINVPLPIELTRFSATALPSSNLLQWETASALNSKGFEVQSQNGAGTWLPIGFVEAQNNAAAYAFEDEMPLQLSYYRLRQIDFDNKEGFSNIISLLRGQNTSVKISPNPTSGKIHITLSTDIEFAQLKVYDVSGKTILSQKTTLSNLEIDLSPFPKGVYMIQIQSDKDTYQEKVLLE
ncbi:MAG: T9SS type A sorting domain-containing protein, partial [Bacteroidia bacterium]